MTKEQRLYYAAGYFDGEGCIAFLKNRNGRSYLRMAVVSGDLDSIRVFVELFGGQISSEKRTHPKTGKASYYFAWRKNGTQAIETLKAILPYLLAKKRQAALAVATIKGVTLRGAL